MGRIGGGELLIILVIALLIFGPSKLADMGKGLGQGLKNFKKGLSHDGSEDDDAKPAAPAAVVPEPPKALTAGTPIVAESAAATVDETTSGVPQSPIPQSPK
jgi:sec-independent protein translocase protein TatA